MRKSIRIFGIWFEDVDEISFSKHFDNTAKE
jgi:hypothetical protein